MYILHFFNETVYTLVKRLTYNSLGGMKKMYFDENNNYFDIMSNEEEFEFNKNYTKNEINNVDVNIDSINFNRGDDLYSPIEGFNKGNMFKKL